MFTANLKNASLPEAVEFLRDLKSRQLDLIAPIGQVKMTGRSLILPYGEDGKIAALNIAPHAVSQIAEKVGIPAAYLRSCLETGDGRLAAENFNYWCQIEAETPDTARNMYLRAYLDDDGTLGVLRAFLSDRYKTIDNLTLLALTLDAINQSEMTIQVDSIDLTDTRLYARFSAPDIRVDSKTLLGNFSDPNGGQYGGLGRDNGITMGFTLSNSETGHGKLYLAPRIKILACANGLMYEEEAFSKTHLGAKLDEGLLSEGIIEANSQLIVEQLKVNVQRFVSKEFLGKRVKELEELKKVRITHPMRVIQGMGLDFSINEEKQNQIFEMFQLINGAENTSPNAWQLSQAFTSWAHVADPEDRVTAECVAVPACINECADLYDNLEWKP